MVRTSNANNAREHIQDAISHGARALIDPALFPCNEVSSNEHPVILYIN
jgi:hypothetical protein